MRNTILSTAVLIACAMAATTAAAAGDTTIGGKGYFDLTNIDQTSDGAKTDASGTGFDAKRFYISVGHTFDDTWSGNITTDFNYKSATGETQLFVKKAYFQAKVSDAFTLRFGSADLPWIPFVEGLYGYRYIENVLIEHAGFGTSADWGVHALGKTANGKVSYDVALIGGAGYKKPLRSKTMDLTGRIAFMPVDGLTLAAGFYNGKRGEETETTPTQHTANRYQLLAAYVKNRVRVGAQYFQAKNWGQVLSPNADKADGTTVWASFGINDKVAIFGRYDDVTPSKDLQPDLKNKYFNLGVAFKPRGGMDLAIVYKQDKVDNGFWGTSNGTIGGIDTGKHREIGLWTQIAF
jgi:hypothetical protein